VLEEVSSGLDCGGKYKMAKRKSIVLSRRTPVGCGASDERHWPTALCFALSKPLNFGLFVFKRDHRIDSHGAARGNITRGKRDADQQQRNTGKHGRVGVVTARR
jgi:hypothetical protein